MRHHWTVLLLSTLAINSGKSSSDDLADVVKLLDVSAFSRTLTVDHMDGIGDGFVHDAIAKGINIVHMDNIQDLRHEILSAEEVGELVVASAKTFEAMADAMVAWSVKVIVLIVGEMDGSHDLLNGLRLDSNFFVASRSSEDRFLVRKLYKVSRNSEVSTIPCGTLRKVRNGFNQGFQCPTWFSYFSC